MQEMVEAVRDETEAPVLNTGNRARSYGATATFAYGMFGLPLAFAALPIYVHVPKLYADGLGMSLSLVGAVLLAVRLCDAVTDPLLGWASDRLANRKLTVLLSLPLLAFGMLGLLQPPEGAGAGWLAGSTLIVTLGFSLATINYAAWGAEAAHTPLARTRIVATREAAALIGVVLAAALPSVLATDELEGIGRLVWVFLPLLVLGAAVTLLATPTQRSVRGEFATPFQNLLGALRHRPFALLLLVFCANGIAAAIPASLVLFFVADVLQAQTSAGLFLVLYFLAGAASLPLWVKFSARVGKLRAWALSMVLAVFTFVWAFALAAGDVWAFAVICVLSGAALGADLSLPPAMLADLLARDTKMDNPQGGAWFGWWNFVSKANLALAAGVALPLLAALGYASGGHDPQGLLALSVVYALVPVVLKLFACALLWRLRHELDFEGALR